MNKLEQVYAAIKQLEDLGLPISKEQRNAVFDVEKEYVETEIIPLLEQEALGLFQAVKSPFSFIMNFDGKTVSIKRNTGESITQERTHRRDPNKADEPKKKKFILSVTLRDGTIICKNKVSETFVEVVKYAGINNVEQLNLEMLGQNMVSAIPFEDGRYRSSQYEVEGKYITTYCDTDRKMLYIQRISDALNLDIKVEKVSLKDVEIPSTQTNSETRRFDRTLYSLEGRAFLPKGKFVHDIVAKILEDNPNMTFESLASLLPPHSSNNKTIIKHNEWLQKNEDARLRYLHDSTNQLKDSRGEIFYVSTQWTKEIIDKAILPVLKKLHYNWEER